MNHNEYVRKMKIDVLSNTKFTPEFINAFQNVSESYEKCYLPWLSTIAAGISTRRFADLITIWKQILLDSQYILEVIEEEYRITKVLAGNELSFTANRPKLIEIATYTFSFRVT